MKKASRKTSARKAKARAKSAPKKGAREASKASQAVKAKKKVSPIPPGFHTITPALACRRSGDAIAFYQKAFGAKVRSRMDMPDGSVAHAELQIGDSRLMLGDEMPAMGASAPQTVGGTPVSIFLYVTDTDKVFQQAMSAGATAEMPPTDMFWGDRYAKLVDPFGHKWSIATHIEDVSPKEMIRRGAEAMAQMAQPA